jgi:hypothetical protein
LFSNKSITYRCYLVVAASTFLEASLGGHSNAPVDALASERLL